jgi:hypothetical protein
MHHPDYSRPLLIIWMCRDCHRELHEWDERVSVAASLRLQVESFSEHRQHFPSPIG